MASNHEVSGLLDSGSPSLLLNQQPILLYVRRAHGGGNLHQAGGHDAVKAPLHAVPPCIEILQPLRRRHGVHPRRCNRLKCACGGLIDLSARGLRQLLCAASPWRMGPVVLLRGGHMSGLLRLVPSTPSILRLLHCLYLVSVLLLHFLFLATVDRRQQLAEYWVVFLLLAPAGLRQPRQAQVEAARLVGLRLNRRRQRVVLHLGVAARRWQREGGGHRPAVVHDPAPGGAVAPHHHRGELAPTQRHAQEGAGRAEPAAAAARPAPRHRRRAALAAQHGVLEARRLQERQAPVRAVHAAVGGLPLPVRVAARPVPPARLLHPPVPAHRPNVLVNGQHVCHAFTHGECLRLSSFESL
mmetsp:Transcript_33949/g.86794  ORF Transcript_33949/g.86794 Transcript_33949/m.86794 type:complete len:355 (-) Transcript_33949:706-1770(-)